MVKTVKVHEAKTQLSALLAEVEGGAEFVISRGNKPVARLIPFSEAPDRELGFVAYDVPASFFDALPGDEVAEWQA